MKQGEVWMVSLDPTIGDEIRKSRPCIIVNDNDIGRLNLRVVVPITEWQDVFAEFPWMVKIESDNKNGLSKTSTADVFQVRSISTLRFVKQLGQVSENVMEQIADALIVTFGIEL